MPIVYNDTLFAVLALERIGSEFFDRETINICEQTLAILSPFLMLKQNNELTWLQKLAFSVKASLTSLFGFQYLAIKLFSLALVIFISLSSMFDGDFKINANAVLEGKIQRTVSALMEGYIAIANARAGDTVLKGDIMAAMEQDDLILEKVKLQSELQQIHRE